MSLGIAILGSGLAAEIHSKTIRAIAPRVRRWYASRDAARSEAMNRRFQGAGSFASYDAALESRDVHGVVIALPPVLHLEWTLKALAAGKHVVVEKPPFLRSTDFPSVEVAAERARRQVLVAENYFYKPLASALREIIVSGALGAVRFIQLTALKAQPTRNWRDDRALAGGGALFEGGIHWISLLASVGLTPLRATAMFPESTGDEGGGDAAMRAFHPERTPASERRVERNAVVSIEYVEGAVATLAYSWDIKGRINGVRMSRIYGTLGSVRFETNGLFLVQTGQRRRVRIPGLRDLAGYRAMTADFLGAIEENRPPKYDLSLARRDLRLIEQAYASHP